MVTLINLKKENNIITADYFPEGNKEDVGHIEYDTNKGDQINVQYCNEDKNSFLKTYFHKAVIAIEKLVEKDSFPNTYKFMWY